MYTNTEHGEGVVAYNVMNLTPYEFQQIVNLKVKMIDILLTHHPKYKGKKKFLSEQDFVKLTAILEAMTRSDEVCHSEFDIVEQKLLERREKAFQIAEDINDLNKTSLCP